MPRTRTAPKTDAPPTTNTPTTDATTTDAPATFNTQPAEVVFDAAFEARALQAAITAHHANQGYCLSIGDTSQAHWNTAPEWQRHSAIQGARAILDGRITEAAGSHEAWMADKLAAGWTFGPVKDERRKTHPCLVPFEQLPAEQQHKDVLFFAVVSTFAA